MIFSDALAQVIITDRFTGKEWHFFAPENPFLTGLTLEQELYYLSAFSFTVDLPYEIGIQWMAWGESPFRFQNLVKARIGYAGGEWTPWWYGFMNEGGANLAVDANGVSGSITVTYTPLGATNSTLDKTIIQNYAGGTPDLVSQIGRAMGREVEFSPGARKVLEASNLFPEPPVRPKPPSPSKSVKVYNDILGFSDEAAAEAGDLAGAFLTPEQEREIATAVRLELSGKPSKEFKSDIKKAQADVKKAKSNLKKATDDFLKAVKQLQKGTSVTYLDDLDKKEKAYDEKRKAEIALLDAEANLILANSGDAGARIILTKGIAGGASDKTFGYGWMNLSPLEAFRKIVDETFKLKYFFSPEYSKKSNMIVVVTNEELQSGECDQGVFWRLSIRGGVDLSISQLPCFSWSPESPGDAWRLDNENSSKMGTEVSVIDTQGKGDLKENTVSAEDSEIPSDGVLPNAKQKDISYGDVIVSIQKADGTTGSSRSLPYPKGGASVYENALKGYANEGVGSQVGTAATVGIPNACTGMVVELFGASKLFDARYWAKKVAHNWTSGSWDTSLDLQRSGRPGTDGSTPKAGNTASRTTTLDEDLAKMFAPKVSTLDADVAKLWRR